MSIETKFELKDAVRKLTVEPIVVAANEVMQDLSPLVNYGASLDEKVTLVLKDTLTRFAQAVQHMFTTTKYSLRALTQLCTLLATPTDMLQPHPPWVISQFQTIAEYFLCGHSSAIDGHSAYADLKREVDDQFRIVLKSYGSDSVVQVIEKGNTTQISLQNLRSTIVNHLGESEKSSCDVLHILAGINVLLRSFLEDEQFSLSKPLTTAPIFSLDTFETWNSLRDNFVRMQVHLELSMEKYKTWFNWTAEGEESILETDRKIRREQIVQPKIKIQVPKPSGPSTAQITVAKRSFRSGECLIRVDRINKTQPGITEVKVVVTVPIMGSWFHTKSFDIICDAGPYWQETTPSPIKVSNKSATLKDITGDPSFEPKGSRPLFKVIQPSASCIGWVFSRPFPLLPWKSPPAFPTQIAVTFNIEHQVCVKLELEASLNYRREFPFKFLTISHPLGGSLLINPNCNSKESAGTGDAPT